MDGKDVGLGLCLSLGSGGNQLSWKVNPIYNTPTPSFPNPKITWNDHFQLPDRNSDARSSLRGIDVNLAPLTFVDCDNKNGFPSPNSTTSSISGKQGEREQNGDENDTERASCSRGSDDEDGGGVGGGGDDSSKKKLKLSKEQVMVLEEAFKEHNTLNPKQKQALANRLNVRPRQVEVWFQNRRARTKLKQTEVDCEYLKRCWEKLREENTRLLTEVQELRALKWSPLSNVFMQMNPPATLTMCPSCQRVTTSTPLGPRVQRPIPLNPWALMSVQHRQS